MATNTLNNHSEKLEKDVIGAILLEKNAIIDVLDFLQPDHFYTVKNQIIYRACSEIYTSGNDINYNSVASKIGFENIVYLTECTQKVASASQISKWAKMVIDFFIKREIAKNAGEQIEMLKKGDDVLDIIENSENQLLKLKNIGQESDGINLVDAFDASLIENQQDNKFLNTGFLDLDTVLKVSRNDLVIIAARPSFGKTALALNIANTMNENGLIGLFFSLEMKAIKLVNRIISAKGEIPHDWFQRKMDAEELKRTSLIHLENNIKIYDKSGIKTGYIRAKAKEMQLKRGHIDFIFIDYIQLITPTDKGMIREQQVSQISRELKNIAMDFDCPVFALSQLSRKSELKDILNPELSHLRESGAIEQDADTVIFLVNHNKAKVFENPADGTPLPNGYCELHGKKQRSGNTFEHPLIFKGEFQKFVEFNNHNANSDDDFFNSDFDEKTPF